MQEFKIIQFDASEFSTSQHKIYARTALKELILKNNIQSSTEVFEHLHLEDRSELKVSLSHTRGAAAAILSDEVRSIGIDIEDKNRNIKDGIIKRITNPLDDASGLNIELWTKKEACFKAAAPLFSEVTILEHIWIKDKLWGILKDTTCLGEIRTQLYENLIVSISSIN